MSRSRARWKWVSARKNPQQSGDWSREEMEEKPDAHKKVADCVYVILVIVF